MSDCRKSVKNNFPSPFNSLFRTDLIHLCFPTFSRYDRHCQTNRGVPLRGERRHAPGPPPPHHRRHQDRSGKVYYRQSAQRNDGGHPTAGDCWVGREHCGAEICRTSHAEDVWSDWNGSGYWLGKNKNIIYWLIIILIILVRPCAGKGRRNGLCQDSLGL